MASHQFAKFGGHRHCDSENIMILGYHVISQDHIIKGSCDFIGVCQLRYVMILPSLVAIGTVVVEI